MDHTYRLTRAAPAAGAEPRSTSIVADADKLLKQYQTRHPGAHAILNEGDGEHVRATISIPENADDGDVARVFVEDAARLLLVANPL